MGSNFHKFWVFFIHLRKLNPVKTNSRQKILQKFTFFIYITEFLWIGCKQYNKNDLPYFVYNNYGSEIESLLSLSKFAFEISSVKSTLYVTLPSIDNTAVCSMSVYPL